MEALIAFVAVVGVVNIWATRRMLASDETGFRKGLAIGMVWLVPFLGVFIAKELVPLAPRRREARTPAAAAIDDGTRELAPPQIKSASGSTFAFGEHLASANGVPVLDWQALSNWAGGFETAHETAEAINLGRRAWLLHLRDALGSHYWLHESEHALVLSSLEPVSARAMAQYIESTRRRLPSVLPGIASLEPEHRSILVLVEDEDSYYEYVSTYYPEEGEFAFSGGMFIKEGCPHFVAKLTDRLAIEPVIAHEMCHSSVAHLALPLWLDEGIAVNTERRLAGAQPRLQTAQQLHAMHGSFWTAERMQEFWSGDSFMRTDDGNLLSYELARIPVDFMSREWEGFVSFANHASRKDAGNAAATQFLGLDLGASVCAILGKEADETWAPRMNAGEAPVPAS